MSLVKLTDIKTYMGITNSDQDGVLKIFQEAVEQSVINFCDCAFEATPIVGEIHDGGHADVIVPNNIPITSVQKVWVGCKPDGTLGTELIEGTDFYFDENAITLVTTNTPAYRGNVRVDYTHGYDGAPPDVKLAVYDAVKALYQRKNRNSEDVGSRSKGDESESYKAAWDMKTGLPAMVVARLQTYKVYEFPNISNAQRNS